MRYCLPLLLLVLFCRSAHAVPDTVAVRVTDVTTSSFSLVWLTDVQAEPAVEVYADAGMATPLSEGVSVTAMPDATEACAAAARKNGVMKVRVTGLTPSTRYFVRSVTRDPADIASVGYSALQEVFTARTVKPYTTAQDGTLQSFGNDLAAMKIYIRPLDQNELPGLGSLLLLETADSQYPLSAFVGSGAAAPEGVLDLNNQFDADRISRMIAGNEVARLYAYRGGSLPTLVHYRRLAVNSALGKASEPVKGFFADINLDGRVDDADFELFRAQYRSLPDDSIYNPDYKFVQTPDGRVDARDFTRFAREYGRSDLPQQ